MQALHFTPDIGPDPELAIPCGGRDCNLFIGRSTDPDCSGTASWCVYSQEEWLDLWWKEAGQAPPAPLPAGAKAFFERRNVADKCLDIALRRCDRQNGLMEWHITETPLAADTKASGYWVICILPEDITSNLYGYSQKPPEDATARQNAESHRNRLAQLARSPAAYKRFKL